METLILALPIFLVALAAVFFIWKVKNREKEAIKKEIQKEIMESGDRGELKVQSVLRSLEKRGSRYRVYHNIKLGPDPLHTNEYDTVVIGSNGIFHIETKNYGGERGGIIDIDSNDNWILHKKSGYSKMITNPGGQVDSHEYRLKGFLMKIVGVKNLPTQGIIVLSCDDITLRYNKKSKNEIPILNRHELLDYIKSYNRGNIILYPKTLKKICNRIEDMNRIARAN